jgi:hypothetical protein
VANFNDRLKNVIRGIVPSGGVTDPSMPMYPPTLGRQMGKDDKPVPFGKRISALARSKKKPTSTYA